ncbi:hypothetical protein HGRIS_002376 [Hohenbuehelia grisea]|uniref:Glucose receptor Git3 N-terminal domain-containing protein n=1 Tax=Hohenbuehelia grisea TaxID=104357 RepID=A0ABR3JL85_9AGAR
MSDSIRLPNGQDFLLRVSYTQPEANGVTVLVVISCISMVAVIGLLAMIALSAFNTRTSKDRTIFVRTHVAAYLVSLLLCNLLQAIASLMNATWIRRGGVNFGNACTVQGALKHISDVGIALWTLVIAINTFSLLFLELKLRPYVLWLTLTSGWFGLGAIVISGPAVLNTVERGPFYGLAGAWCWISDGYTAQRTTLDYMFMFISLVLSSIIYTLVYLRLRGYLVVSGWYVRLRFNGSDRGSWHGRIANDQALVISRQMLLYPVTLASIRALQQTPDLFH